MQIFLLLVLPWLVFAGAAVLLWPNRERLGWQIPTHALVTLGLLALGLSLLGGTHFITIPWNAGGILTALGCIGVFLGVIEFAIFPLLGQFRLGAIARVTYYEALLQPFTIIVIWAGFVAIAIAASLEYFTYNEDFKMYRDVASSFVFLFSLPILVFASTKVVDEEIENRTMLILMSKPVSRWQVILGKYLGVMLLMLVTVLALGTIATTAGYIRYFDDMVVDYRVAFDMGKDAVRALDLDNYRAAAAMAPSLVLTFLQLATLSAISVALSTRYGLAVNVTVVFIIYIAANIAGFAQNTTDRPAIAAMGSILSYLLPALGTLDLNQRLVFGNFLFFKTDFLSLPGILPTYGRIWGYVGLSAVYALFYIGAALSLGMALFRSRELT